MHFDVIPHNYTKVLFPAEETSLSVIMYQYISRRRNIIFIFETVGTARFMTAVQSDLAHFKAQFVRSISVMPERNACSIDTVPVAD